MHSLLINFKIPAIIFFQGLCIALLLVLLSCLMVTPIFMHTDLWNFPFMIEKEFYCEVNLMPHTRYRTAKIVATIRKNSAPQAFIKCLPRFQIVSYMLKYTFYPWKIYEINETQNYSKWKANECNVIKMFINFQK